MTARMFARKLNALLLKKPRESALYDVTVSIDNAIRKITFSATQTSGYFVEQGGGLNLKDTKSVTIDIATGKSRREQVLFCFFSDKTGNVLFKRRISIINGRGASTIKTSADTVKMNLALHLEGARPFPDISLKIARHFASDKKQTAAIIPLNKKENRIAEKASAVIQQRNFLEALEYLKAHTTPDSPERKLLLRCYASLHEFEHLVSEYEAMSPRRRAENPARILYLTALANLGLTDKARRLIEESCLNLKIDHRNQEFLATIYPFAMSISDDLADLVFARILTTPGPWTNKSAASLTRCAHDLINAKRYEDFYKCSNIISSLPLTTQDQAKFEILRAQAAYVLGRHDVQMEALNKAMSFYGVAPIFSKTLERPFDLAKISSPSCIPKSVRGPKVSVLMTSYNSEETIKYALKSLMRQTYRNIEIIVIDDASTDKSRSRIRKLRRQDKRIRLISLPVNGGTYVAKNHGLLLASGTFVTCQDSDDWAHPQKIERMVAVLTEDKNLIATAVQHVRYDPARGFRGHGAYIRFDASSLMYRRKEVMEKIGFYDSVRAGADSEFQFRMERAFGRGALKKLPHLLSLVLWSERSLSGGGTFAIDDEAGIFSEPRNAYRRAFSSWQESTSRLFVNFPMKDRPFQIPIEMRP